MGIMTRLYHRSGGLSDNPYKQLFLDMGENIHIHYRDLRIELSVPEFLEFAEIFERCAPMVRDKIEGGYMDGVLPNTNELTTLTTISHNKPLQHPIKYNANRISIEENFDGYHIHFRNYKLLFDKRSFDNILQAMNDVIERRDSQRTLDEVLHLISYNDLEYHLVESNRDGVLKTALVEVEKKYFGKLRQVFKALRFSHTEETREMHIFRGEQMEIRARLGKGGASKSAPIFASAPYILLADYLTARKDDITPKELNLLRLQVLNAFGMVSSGENTYIDLDFNSFLLTNSDQRVVFQTTTTRHVGGTTAQYEKFSEFLYGLGLHSIKPSKIIFSEDESKEILESFQKHIAEYVTSQPCVMKMYMLGSSKRNNMGHYEVPFVSFDWAKLASDFDVFIEIDEQFPVPDIWQKKFFWKKAGAYYYHLGDAPHHVDSPYVAQYNYAKFFHHLIEAYLFFPTSGDLLVKDKFLADFKAELIYEKTDSSGSQPSTTFNWLNGVAGLMRNNYSVSAPVVSEIAVPSHNKVFRVDADDAAYVVKVYNSNNFTPARVGSKAAHIQYESLILSYLEQSGVEVIPACRDCNDRTIHDVGSLKAMVFRYLDGKPYRSEQGQIATSANVLAKVHQHLAPDSIPTNDFDYVAFLSFWFGRLDALSKDPRFATSACNGDAVLRISAQVRSWFDAAAEWQELIWVHGHGDINPRNYIYHDNSAFLFDFQAARFMPRLGDIADGMIEFGIDGSELVGARMDAFLRAYEAVSPLTPIERKHQNAFLLSSCMVKMLIMLQNDLYFGYKVNSPRMRMLLDYCAGLAPKTIS